MRKRSHPLRTLSLLIGLAATALAALGAWRTLTVTDAAAVQRMDAEERVLLHKLGRLDRGMSQAEVESVLGPASHWTQLGADQEGRWNDIPGAPLASLHVYVDHGAATRVRWMKLGHFTYKMELPRRRELGAQ
jgi:hypothetical protein